MAAVKDGLRLTQARRRILCSEEETLYLFGRQLIHLFRVWILGQFKAFDSVWKAVTLTFTKNKCKKASKNMVSPRCYVLVALFVFILFIVGICIQNAKLVFPSKQEWPIEWSQEVVEKAIELEHCERKLLLKTGNMRKTGLNVLTPWLAPIIWDGIYNIKILDKQHKGTRIGLFVFAVKKYIQFLLPFLESAERYFMVGHHVTYYVFTDKVNDLVKPKMADGRILQLHNVAADQRWQDVSMRRMETLTIFTKEHMPNEIDYLICADVDMVFNDHVGVEILGDLVATLHPVFFLFEPKSFTYERRPISAAYIPQGEGDFYYMAALYGGKVEEIYKLSMECQKGIMEDKKKGIEAVWQDESHLNRYLFYNKPTKILSPEYIWDTDLPNGEFIKKKRFLAVHKNHRQVRN
ncbi:histo-blood group ABO system transferase 2-like isoform X3 [Ranitomeya variabilis]|uniref:histo-blood group ABO system transferase 2-like isoform X3 n=1 Tax=Ranitomeya variabilis TaxID=490064 RepID=UPI004056CF26